MIHETQVTSSWLQLTAGLPRGWTSPDPMAVVDYLSQIYPWMDQEYHMLHKCLFLRAYFETNG
jgi:hypothetical protein